MVKCISVVVIALFLGFTSCNNLKEHEVKSPSGDLLFKIGVGDDTNQPVFSVNYLGSEVIGQSTLGMSFKSGVDFSKSVIIESIKTKSVDTGWKPVYGEKSAYVDRYNESLVDFKSQGSDNSKYSIRIRVYDEGVAFRYEFDSEKDEIVNEEHTSFNLPDETFVWSASHAQGPIQKHKISEVQEMAERPLLVQVSDTVFMALGEAGLVDFARMKFELTNCDSGIIGVHLSEKDIYADDKSSCDNIVRKGHYNTPWRFAMVGKSAGQLLENNYFVLNLNAPNKIEDTSWIKPGKVIREVTLTTIGGKACVDFAVKNNLQYILFDAGWYGNEYDTASDATTITLDPKRSPGPLELLEVIDYAKKRDIGVILYVNHRALEKQLDEILPLFKKWGVAGVKYGFVNVGNQKWTSWLHEAIRKAAKYKIMVDVHDEYRPTGYSRTYPNLMTQEGIRGDEESTPNEMVINTIFTRMIAGAGDQTNCYLASRVDEKMGSHASQMAKTICIYSPWQFLFWYDRPVGSPLEKGGAGDDAVGVIPDLVDLEFYKKLPTVWDDTKVLGGYPGEYVLMARRSGDSWYVGGITGASAKNFNISLDFLKEGEKYEAQIFSDDQGLKTRTNVNVEIRAVDKNTILNREVQKRNGFAIIINKK